MQFKDLLDARVHFGHKKSAWNPKMKPYIYTERNGLHIIDVRKSVQLIREAYNVVANAAADGAEFLFVGTKKQAADVIEKAATRVGASWVSERWLGGTLTNFSVIRKSVEKFIALCEQIEQGEFKELPKKEQIRLNRKRDKMECYFKGIQNMKRVPDFLFVVDVINEDIAVKEGRLLEIPVVAIVDTNADPDLVDYPIPANDDAIESIRLITSIIEMAITEGQSQIVEESDE
ncbi:30S ribosomal protein S2 [candidate division WOR-3 bacterium]|nr:30S ribosomal protein S2 [candidate division WOR-3 bacterium]MCK4527385.1 30S ribosomal protein S2 [candidate division WOR-3 bacterium]